MLSQEENELITRTGPGAPMGDLMRGYWMPARLSEEIPVPNPHVDTFARTIEGGDWHASFPHLTETADQSLTSTRQPA